MVPHWERSPQESVRLLPPTGSKGEAVALTAVVLGGSVPTPRRGVAAEVIELPSLDELAAAKWSTLFEPSGIYAFSKVPGGTAVNPLLMQGAAVAGLTPDSQRYFDYHHTAIDRLDKVNPRELHLGAAALASLIWLVDTQGLSRNASAFRVRHAGP